MKNLALAAQEELKRRAVAELERRRDSPEYTAWVKADIVAGLHDHQRAALLAPERYKAFSCSRRAGKTALIARMIVLTLLDAGYNQWVFFVAPTLGIGRDLIWAEVEMLHERYHLGWTLKEHEGYIETQRKGKFRIVGLDKTPQVEKLRGYDTLLFCTDETQTYEHLVPPLLTAVAPALTGRRGTWVSAGTPGPARRGFWFDICHDKQGFRSLHWTVMDNPKNPRPGQEVIDEEVARMGLTHDHPTVRREWYGEWVEDSNFLVCDFVEARNVVSAPPSWYSLETAKHVIGIDYGYTDACAWTVVAIDPYSRHTFVVENHEEDRLLQDDVARITRDLVERFRTTYVVCDPAGGGKPFFEAFNARHGRELGCTIRGADKIDKLGGINLLNTELRTGRLQIAESAVALRYQLGTLRWKDEQRVEILEGVLYPDHSFDALRYALNEAAPWAVQGRDPPKDAEQKAREERNRRERERQRRPWYERKGF